MAGRDLWEDRRVSENPTVAIVGGTGAEGSGLGLRLAAAGYTVVIGSRDDRKARKVAAELNEILGRTAVSGSANGEAAAAAEIVMLTVPYQAQMPTVREIAAHLQGKILVDVTVPLVPPKVSRVQLPPDGSCVLAVQRELGSGVRVVSGFQNVSAHKLRKLDQKIACDVLVCSDDADARKQVIVLAEAMRLRGIDAGPLANSVAAEALTSLLIWINRTYKVPDAGIAITGIGTLDDVSGMKG
jgi:NADPH-dependent F420 reductase